MILLLDNYDSFVHNLARYFRIAGCETKIVRSDECDVQQIASLQPTGIVISPGPKRPEDAGCSVAAIRHFGHTTAILGVCLGHQAIAVACGGIVRPCEPMHGMSCQITHDGQELFDSCPSPMEVARYHSLAIDEATLPNELMITARTVDDGPIMAVRHRQWPVYGVQFHPESVLTSHGQTLVSNFARIALERFACR